MVWKCCMATCVISQPNRRQVTLREFKLLSVLYTLFDMCKSDAQSIHRWCYSGYEGRICFKTELPDQWRQNGEFSLLWWNNRLLKQVLLGEKIIERNKNVFKISIFLHAWCPKPKLLTGAWKWGALCTNQWHELFPLLGENKPSPKAQNINHRLIFCTMIIVFKTLQQMYNVLINNISFLVSMFFYTV